MSWREGLAFATPSAEASACIYKQGKPGGRSHGGTSAKPNPDRGLEVAVMKESRRPGRLASRGYAATAAEACTVGARLHRAASACLLLGLGALAAAGPAQAQVQRAFINLGFENPALNTAGCRVYINATQVPGWNTTHPNTGTENSGGCVVAGGLGATPGPILEIWRTPRDNSSGGEVRAPEGVQIAELNAAQASRIYQNVCLISGENVSWRFSHRGRGSAGVQDVAEMKVGATGSVVRVGTTNSGSGGVIQTFQGSATSTNIAGNTSWRRYVGQFSHTGSTGNTNMGFEAISAQGGDTNGNLLDEIQIQLAPFVEFTSPSSSTPESSSDNRPTLRVNGNVYTAFTVRVDITGGTAALGTDFTTPDGTATMLINVPAGTYDGNSSASLFALPITVINDAVSEGNETIEFTVRPATVSPAPFQLASSASCGGAPQTTWVYTIVDNDAGLSVSKAAGTPTAVGGNLSLQNVVYTITVSNPSTVPGVYGLTDTPGLDADTVIQSASYTRTGGGSGGGAASGSLTGSGPWTLTSNRTLPGGQTDTFTVTVQVRINPGLAGADNCASPSAPGAGLHNSATATLQAPAGTFTATACQNTPTPVWVSLSKNLTGRALSTDQVQVRLYSAGILNAPAPTTTGSAVPATATTGQRILPAGSAVQFTETVKANGTGADTGLGNYTTDLVCTNSTAGSGTVSPSGAGTDQGTYQQWPQFTPAAGDNLSCTITNTPRGADLAITKSNSGTSLVSGTQTTYQIVVTNLGPNAAPGAVVTDVPSAGLSCTAPVACTAGNGALCPGNVASGSVPAASLLAGVAIPVLPSGGVVTLQLTCDVE